MPNRILTALMANVALASGYLVAPAVPGLAAQQTRAESSNYQETSSLADVNEFLRQLDRATSDVRLTRLGRSTEGRDIPLIVAARPMVSGPVEAHRSGKPVVYLQGNIHGGEVEGKEAALMLLRDLALGPHRSLLDSLVLLVVPVYNTDGNEAFGPAEDQRPGQNGPDPVGLRRNGQGLDLNRDYVKQEAPETRAATALINLWDPQVFIDLHTTNGSYHGYALTYSPGLSPNSSVAGDWSRDTLLPAVQQRIRERHGHEIFPYGNFRNQHPDSLNQGWFTYDPRPRFGTNWFGLRGGMAILSEGYSNAPFSERVASTYDFVLEILRMLAEHRETVIALAAASDRWQPDSISIRADFAPPGTAEVIAELTEPAGDGTGPFARRRRTGTFRRVTMPVYDRFSGTRAEPLTAGYLLPPALSEAALLLQRQGVAVERLIESWRGEAERFSLDSLVAAERSFEGHRTVRVDGRWRQATVEVSPGWFWVDTGQKLGVLAGYLLEPAAADGLAAWNFLDRQLRVDADYPVIRVRSRPPVATTAINNPSRGADVESW